MSVEVISWALNKAPVDESSAAFVLVGLANHAGPDGRGAFPSVARLVSYTRLSERTVREQLDILESAGVIVPCDPAIVAAYIKRADQRPQGWDLNLTLDRNVPAHLARFQAAVEAVKEKRRKRRAKRDGVQPSQVDERGATVAPRSQRGATVTTNEVQPSPNRGATVAPEPSVEPPIEPSLTLLSVGELQDRNARAAATAPSANYEDLDRVAGVVLGQMPEHYRSAPAWLRARILKRITDALYDHSPMAIVEYSHKFAGDPNFGDYEHIRRFDDVIRKLEADITDGTACAGCGRDPEHPFCTSDDRNGHV
jgi:hypothetical protein